MTYKNVDDLATSINPTQRDEMSVIENLPDKIILMKKTITDMMELTVDVLFPKDGNGYIFYVSDYPKTSMPGKFPLVNLSKLYMLKCKDISKAK